MTVAIADADVHGQHAAGWSLVLGIVLASLAEAIAGTILSLGRGDIMGDTYATPDEFAWLDIGYVAAKFIGLALTPWLMTRISPQVVLFAATLSLGAACTGAALTTHLDVLIIFRAVQGLSGGIVLAGGQTVLFWSFPRSDQPMLQALFAMGSVVAPATIAPALQGWLLDTQTWTWIFFCVLPVSLAAAGLIIAEKVAPLPSNRRKFDWFGFAFISMFVASATYLLSQGSRWDWFEANHIRWLSVVAGCSLALFMVQQRLAGPYALLDWRVFKVDDFSFAFLVSFVAGAALFGSAYLIPSFAVSVLGFTPTDAGRLLLPSVVPFVAALLLTAYLIRAHRLPPIVTVPVGILLVMVAMWMLSYSSGESGAADMLPAILLRGLGLGFLFLSITLVSFTRLKPSTLASGISMFNIGRQFGGLIGVASLQTLIDHQATINRSVLGAALTQNSSALSERLAFTTSVLTARGMESDAATTTSRGMLSHAVAAQANAIAFDTAFNAVALLFVLAAPIVIAFKVVLARRASLRRATLELKP